jgi:hypothetical protein
VIEHLYYKHFRKERPDIVLSIEEKIGSQKESSKAPRKTEAPTD